MIMPSVTRTLSEWAASARFEDLPDEVVHQTRRFLLDSVACALGGSLRPDVAIARRVISRLAGRDRSLATVLVTGERLDPVSAAFLNALQIRALDFNDIYWKQDPCHPSDLIPAVLAAAELRGAPGRELLLGIALAYELEQRLAEVAFPGLREVGWHHATLTSVAAPIAAGRVLGLDAERIANAVGISASRHAVTGSVAAGGLTMMKNAADPLAVKEGLLAALLAEEGFTGPAHVLDGKEGLGEVLGTEWRFATLAEGLGRDPWRILRCGMKACPTEALTHSPITALLDLVREHDLRPEAVARITVHTLTRAADILADPSKYDPRTRETADHSLPYVLAAALVERRVTPAELAEEKLRDPILRAQLGKVVVLADPEADAAFPEMQRARVEVELVDGRTIARRVDHPRGDPRSPLTDGDLRAKFLALSEEVCTPDRAERMIAAIDRAESFEDTRALAAELTTTNP
jgi:2-methylcitrate dehydratase